MAGEYHETDFRWTDIAKDAEAVLAAKVVNDTDRSLDSFAATLWEGFHKKHNTARFFKERRYLTLAFPFLVQTTPPLHVVELGAGCGASIVPVLKANPSCRATVCDVSPTAIATLRRVATDAGIAQDRVCAFPHDAASAQLPPPLARADADCCLLVFTLSAVKPHDMRAVLGLAFSALRPGGRLLIRDYGLYDMTQLRFPALQRLGERLYHRSDGTLAYFFSREDLTQRAEAAGFECSETHYACVHVRNRKQLSTMRRVFVQGTFFKPLERREESQ